MNHVIVGDHCVFNKECMPDVQNTRKDFYPVPIKKVGVRNVEAPILVWQRDEEKAIQVHATFSAYVELTEDSKGINMSRNGRVIMEQAKKHMNIDLADMKPANFNLVESIVRELQTQHKSKTAYVKCKFSYPSWTKVFASKLDTVEYVDIVWEAIADGDDVTELMTVENVGISLCPCSKEMSLLTNNFDAREKQIYESWVKHGHSNEAMEGIVAKISKAGFGAHNQRSHVAVTVQIIPNQQVWFEDLIAITDKSFSAPIRAILKREDEKVEGELAYLGGYYDEYSFNKVEGTGPKFVEDIARDAARQLDLLLDTKIADYIIQVRNDESIHSRALEAVAVLTAGRNLQ